MIPDDVPDLPADVALLLADARTLRGPSAEARARLRSRLPLPPPPGGGNDGGPSGGDAAPSGPSPSAAVGSAGASIASALPKVPLWGAALLFAAGVGVGVFGVQLRAEAPVAREAASPSTVVSALVVATTTAVKAPASAASVSAPITVALADLPNVGVAPVRSGEVAKPEPGASLAGERALLDVARTALGRGDGANASTACAEHARKYPNGALVEEREAIAIQALVLEGRKEDATQRAARFRTRHPRSILLPAVLASVGLPE